MNKAKLKKKAKECPECGSLSVKTVWVDYQFPYGTGRYTVQLVTHVPSRECKRCGFMYLDAEAEELIDKCIRELLKKRETNKSKRRKGD